jgi:hypothetical protein
VYTGDSRTTQGLNGEEMLTGWLSMRYHFPNGVRINPDFSVNKSFSRYLPCRRGAHRKKFYDEKKRIKESCEA